MVDAQAVRRINAIIMNCGHCDASGDFAFRVGSPAGNSLVGALALESLARRTGWSVF